MNREEEASIKTEEEKKFHVSSEQKAAAVIVAVGTENASLIYKYLSDDEQERLSVQVTKLKRMPQETIKQILQEFYDEGMQAKISNQGGAEYAKAIMEKAFGGAAATSMMEKIEKNLRADRFKFLNKIDSKNIYAQLQREHPQLIALVLSYISAEKTGEILRELEPKLQINVIGRIAETRATSPDIINIVESKLERQFRSATGDFTTKVGGIDYVADVLNNMDISLERFIFDELNNEAPDLAEKIREKMFVFEDISLMRDVDIQRFIRDVNTSDLVLAIKGTTSELASVIFANMSERNAETIRSELEYTKNVRVKEVEDAQQRIVAVIRRLEEEGHITISKAGRNDIIA